MRLFYLYCLLPLLFAVSACTGVDRTLTPAEATGDGIRINAYFSQTSGNYKEGGGIDDLLIADIRDASEEIKVAIYALTNDRIRDALISAHHRGVAITLVTDDGEYEDEDMQVLRAAGITIYHDHDPYALMHNKFMIVDRHIVWSGSCNYTYYAFYRNNENLVKITGSKIASVYLQEFDELLQREYIEHAFVSESIEIYFSPEDDFAQRLITLIEGARERIDFLAFAFTSQEIADALLAKKAQGLPVHGVIDEKQNSYQKSSQYEWLKKGGIEVYLDANSFTMHNKVMIIDDTVVTGSYNFTQKANDTNNENSIVVHNALLAERYRKEFEKIFSLAKEKNQEE